MNTPTKDNSKRSQSQNKTYETYNMSLTQESPQQVASYYEKDIIEYPKHLIPLQGQKSAKKLDEVYIEDRFSKTLKQPHK